MQRFAHMFLRVVQSTAFYRGVITVFVFQAVWIALSAVYPMAFDEDFHMGVIRIYAEQWSPFLTSQPAGADIYGALVHDPSYLYHYLMSFPYRFLAAVTDSEMAQILVLRGINIGLFVIGLVLFRRVLLRAGVGRALTHLCIAAFVLVPIVPFLAGQVNYDNFIMVLMPLLCLAAFNLVDGFKVRQIRMGALLGFIIVGMAACLVKYAFLPILMGALLFLAYKAWRAYRGAWSTFLPGLRAGWRQLSLWRAGLLIVALVLVSVLFGQRYGVNMAQFKTPVPDCAVALNEKQCMSYGPWARNTQLAAAKPADATANPVIFFWHWLYGMWLRLHFAVNGPASLYTTRRPLPVSAVTVFALAVIATVAAVVLWRRMARGRMYLGFFLAMILCYVGLLWLEQYSQFVETGEPVAINGRYLVPVLLPLLAIWGLALGEMLRKWPIFRAASAAVLLALLIYGAGLITFIVRSDASWNWPNKAIIQVNDNARHLLKPLIIEGPPS